MRVSRYAQESRANTAVYLPSFFVVAKPHVAKCSHQGNVNCKLNVTARLHIAADVLLLFALRYRYSPYDFRANSHSRELDGEFH